MADQQSTNHPDSEFISEFNKYFSPRTTSVVNCPKKGRRTSRRKSRAKKHAKTRGRTKRFSRAKSPSKIYNGGGFGGDIHLSPMMVPITNTQFDEFNRTFQNNMDCFITAIQMLGYIDLRTADLMRMTFNGIVGGFFPEQMDCIMMYLTHRNQDFRRCDSIEHWWQHITGVPNVFTGLAPGQAYIAGYLGATTNGHIFIIARASNPTEGTECNPVFPVYIIDVVGPNKRIIEINDSNYRTIMNDPSGDVRSFHIMYYNPVELLTAAQQQIVIDLIPTLQSMATMPASVFPAVPTAALTAALPAALPAAAVPTAALPAAALPAAAVPAAALPAAALPSAALPAAALPAAAYAFPSAALPAALPAAAYAFPSAAVPAAALPAAAYAFPSPARAASAESDEDVVESSYMERMRRLGLGP